MTRQDAAVDVVLKIGGGLLAHEHFRETLSTIATAASRRRLLIVPGGGPFADKVREVDLQIGLTGDAAHWMAVLAMDQYAHLLVSLLPGSQIVDSVDTIQESLATRHVPILAPSRWLRACDPLPHSWDVTSDSIAAWVAGEVGASELVLVKPPAASEPLVDAYFSTALPPHVTPVIVRAGDQLRTALEGLSPETSR